MAALPSDVLTLVVLVPLTLAGCWSVFRHEDPVVLVAEALTPILGGALVWTLGSVLDAEVDWRAVPTLLALGTLSILRPRPALESAAALTGAVAAVAALASSGMDLTALALHLTLAGTLVVASSLLNPHRRMLGWPGGALLAAATWARLADIGVEQPEAYTLPSALALLAAGGWQLWAHREAGTHAALIPGLTLAVAPSLLWALVDPISLRSILLGLACLGLVGAGVRLRWSAPLLVGTAAGGLLVLRLAQPYAAEIPPWILIGLAGTLFTVVGITWEHRRADVRHAAAYVGRLR